MAVRLNTFEYLEEPGEGRVKNRAVAKTDLLNHSEKEE